MRTATNRKKSLLHKLISANSNIELEHIKSPNPIIGNGKLTNSFLKKLKNSENSKLFDAIYKKWVFSKGGQTSIKYDELFDDEQHSFKRNQTGVFQYKKLNLQNRTNINNQVFNSTDINMMGLLKTCLFTINPYLVYHDKDQKVRSQSYFENAILTICDKYQIDISKIDFFSKSKTINISLRTADDTNMFSMINSYTSSKPRSNKVLIIPSHAENITIYYKAFSYKRCERLIDDPGVLSTIKKIIGKNDGKNLDSIMLLKRVLTNEESE